MNDGEANRVRGDHSRRSLLSRSPALSALIRCATWRSWGLRLLAVGAWGGTAGCVLALGLLVAHRLTSPAWGLASPLAATVAGTALLVFVGAALWLRRDRFAAARELERHYGLDEELTSILTLDEGMLPPEIAAALLRDGEARSSGCEVARALPLARPKGAWPLAAALVVLVLAWGLLPSYDLLGIGAARTRAEEEKKRIASRDAELRKHFEALRKVAEQKEISLEAKQVLAKLAERKQLDAAAPEAREARREALVEMDRMRQEIEALRARPAMQGLDKFLDHLDRQSGSSPEDPALREAATALVQGDLEKAVKAMRELAKRLDQQEKSGQPPSGRELDALRKDLERLGKLFADMPSASLEGLSPDQLAKLLAQNRPGNLPQISESMARELESLARWMREQELLDSALEQIELTEAELASLPEELADLEMCEDCKKGPG